MKHVLLTLVKPLAQPCVGTSFPPGFWTQAGAPSTFNFGVTDIGAHQDDWGADICLCYRWQAPSSGTLQTASLYHTVNYSGNHAKVAVYTSSAATPQAGDTQVGISADLSGGGTTGWKTSAMSGGAITSGNYYWIAVFISTADGWSVQSDHSATLYYRSGSGYYASPPSNLTGTGSLGGYGTFSCYIVAQ